MAGKPIRVYADASVYGGVFDGEFDEPSRLFFGEVRGGRFRLVISPLVGEELKDAPEQVRKLFASLRPMAEVVDVTAEAVRLQQAYLASRILGPKSETDALHVAIASVNACAVIVSWNFRHIVNFARIPLYNGVNMSKGYAPLAIHSPQEVIHYEDEGV